MKIRWHGEARAEADAAAAAAFYHEKQPGLTQRFLDNLEEALHKKFSAIHKPTAK